MIGKDINFTDIKYFCYLVLVKRIGFFCSSRSRRLGKEKKSIPSGWVTVKKEERGGVEQ